MMMMISCRHVMLHALMQACEKGQDESPEQKPMRLFGSSGKLASCAASFIEHLDFSVPSSYEVTPLTLTHPHPCSRRFPRPSQTLSRVRGVRIYMAL